MGAPSWHPEANPPSLPAAGPTRHFPLGWILLVGCLVASALVALHIHGATGKFVTYSVTSHDPSARAHVFYRSGGKSQQGDVSLPWSTVVTTSGGTVAIVVRAAVGTTSLRCAITAGDSLLASSTALGDHPATTCTAPKEHP